MGFSFVHGADLHLGSSFSGIKFLPKELHQRVLNAHLTAFEKLIDFCLSEKVEFLVLAGDTFHEPTPSLRMQKVFIDQLERLAAAKIDVFIVTGNHDSGVFANFVFNLPSNVYTFPTDQVGYYQRQYGQEAIDIYGISYPQAQVKSSLLPLFPKPKSDRFSLGILHCDVGGGQDSSYAPVSSSELNSSGHDYWALGHVHTPVLNSNNKWYYPGVLQGSHLLEVGEKGFYHVVYQDKVLKPKFIPVQDIIWQSCTLDISQLSFEEVTNLIIEQKEECRQTQGVGTMLQINLVGNTDLNNWLDNQVEMQEFLDTLQVNESARNNFVWIYQIENHTRPLVDLSQLQKQGDFLAEVLDFMDQLTVEDFAKLEQIWEPVLNTTCVTIEPQEVISKAKLRAALLLRGELE